MEDFRWFSWIVSLGLTAWVVIDAKRRLDGRWMLWAFLAFFFPWVFGPVYWFFLRGGSAKATALQPPARRKGAVTRTGRTGRTERIAPPGRNEPDEQDAAIEAMAAEIVGAPTPAARADFVRQVGRTWADAVGSDTKAGGVATIRVLVESAAEATARGDVAKAQEQMDKALSHVRGAARRHLGGRIILAGLAQLAREAPPTPAVPTPAERPTEPAPLVYSLESESSVARSAGAAASDAVPAFITSRTSGPLQDAAPSPVRQAPTVPPIATLAPDLAQRFRDEPLEEFSERVAALSARWLAEVSEQAPSIQRSYARVKLESAVSAVFRGDFRRAIEMTDAAAELMPADVEPAATLRAGLRCALEARNG